MSSTDTGRSERRVLLTSFYEGGFQPISLGTTAAHLREAQFDVEVVDAFFDEISDESLAGCSYVCLSLPLFQSLERAAPVMPRLREAGRPIIVFGQHATIVAELLLNKGTADWVVRGDWEVPLVQLLRHLEGETADGLKGVSRRGEIRPTYIHRGPVFHPPDRRSLPPLSRYKYELADRFLGPGRVVANVEASRGCHHACAYCSVFAAYDKKVALVPAEVVLQDVRNCVELGAQHLCFVDAEFLNSKTHGLKIARQLHAEFPELTFDFTARADHLLDCREGVAELVELGARFVTSAFEFPSGAVMKAVDKELEVDHCVRAVRMCEEIGLGLNPTFLTFNPWTTLEETYRFADFLEETGLDKHLDPLQLETRLYLPKGSRLVGSPALAGVELEEKEYHYEWKHPDPRVDQVFQQVLTPIKPGEFKRCCIKC
ncbi:MAG: RCCLKC-tail radical SAM protein [Pyrinomonadaceae bacterium]